MRFVILLFLVASFCLNAQSDRGHFIGINFSPAITYMSNVNPILGPPALFHSNPYFGGSAGVSTLWDIHPRLKLQTDILYSVYSETQSRIVTNQKLSFPEGTEIAYLKIEYHSLSIPVLLNYYFYKGRWSGLFNPA
ncbi:MAG: outer membrane beta-barrel protein [Cryomorphaceae bacterium]|nr:outer membrane beta-barrel protein [Cryomorphaceae bacterium]